MDWMDYEPPPGYKSLMQYPAWTPDMPRIRTGVTFVAAFDGPIAELKIRRGRLTVKVGDMWHIVKG